jgi:hypothetical protein
MGVANVFKVLEAKCFQNRKPRLELTPNRVFADGACVICYMSGVRVIFADAAAIYFMAFVKGSSKLMAEQLFVLSRQWLAARGDDTTVLVWCHDSFEKERAKRASPRRVQSRMQLATDQMLADALTKLYSADAARQRKVLVNACIDLLTTQLNKAHLQGRVFHEVAKVCVPCLACSG